MHSRLINGVIHMEMVGEKTENTIKNLNLNKKNQGNLCENSWLGISNQNTPEK